MTLQEEVQKRDILKELVRGVHMPSFCDEEGRCEALDDCTEIDDANECSCCGVNHIVRAFNRGIEFQKQKSPWISVENAEEDLPCNRKELLSKEKEGYTELVMAYTNIGIIFVSMRKYDDGWKWDTGNYLTTPKIIITHWMPIPKLPKEL